MKRTVLFAAGLLLALGILALPAMAHGGQFRGPGDGVPPGLREPSDPTPPPPPPPSGPPSTPAPTTPTPSTAPPSAPTTPTAAPPPTTAPDTTTTKGRATQPSFEDWTFWYHNNKSDIESLKERVYALMSSDNPLFRSGDEGDGSARTGATRLTQRKVQEVIIPALLWAMDPKNAKHQDTESAAYIALAKIAREPEQIQIIQTGLSKETKRDVIVQESTALALGLLRRADKANQFTARELDRVREFLFGVFLDTEYGDRTRGFAAIAIGLLGDQPTGSGDYANDVEAAARATTKRLFDLLEGTYTNGDLYVGLLMAIGLQPHTSLDVKQREILADCALKGRLGKENAAELTRAYAAHSLGRIGTVADIKVLENILSAKRGMPKNVQRSAAIGLGLLSRLVTGPDRVETAKVLLSAVDKAKDPSTANFALISLAYLINDDLRAQATDVISNTNAEEILLETTEKGSYLQRPFGALALALIVREVSDEVEIEQYQKLKEDALKLLRMGVADAKGDKKTQAGFCTAVGVARDSRSRESLRLLVDDTKEDKVLRGYAALGLGLIGEPTAEVLKSIAEAMRERSSEDLRRQTAIALGLLGNRKIPGTGKTAIELLVDNLRDAQSQNEKGQIVLALASIGDHNAVDPLVDILRNTDEQDLTRALACAGLGLVGDLEWIPSLSRASKHVNYRASTDLVNELLSIL